MHYNEAIVPMVRIMHVRFSETKSGNEYLIDLLKTITKGIGVKKEILNR